MTTPNFTLEIIPMMLVDYHLWLLLPRDVAREKLWLEPHPGDCHPNETVIRRTTELFQSHFDPTSSIVHSTSWRYLTGETPAGTDQLVLTYVVILQSSQDQSLSWSRTDGRITTRSFRRSDLVFEDNLYAPDKITSANVVAHAIEHLALLARRDPPIRSTLDETWRAFLANQLPQPAREIHIDPEHTIGD
ncbi:MAG: hypothetical protein ACT4QE_05445 [Anaerolineales bacterium]